MNMQYAVWHRPDREKIADLVDIGFWRGDIPESPCWRDYHTLIKNIRLKEDTLADIQTTDGGTPDAANADAPLLQDDFLLTALQLMGYRPGVDFPAGAFRGAAKKAGLVPVKNKEWTGKALLCAFYDLLCLRGRQGRTLMDKALENGALRSYNTKKKCPAPLFFAGRALPVFSPKNAITERVYVETDLDTDQDGRRDRIAVYIRRPAETDRGLRVPAMYTANPYAPGWNEDLYKLHPVDGDLAVKEAQPQNEEAVRWHAKKTALPPASRPKEKPAVTTERPEEFEELQQSMNQLQQYLLVRGFATVFSGGIGTRRSDGMRSCGASDETDSTVAVIEWLAGSRRAYTTRRGNTEIKAFWCNGNVGMCGKSYLGTLSIAAASTGTPALKCILAESAISDWYRYYRENGLTSAALDWQGDDADLLAKGCMSRLEDRSDAEKVQKLFDAAMEKMQRDQDRITANYNAFWDARNYLKHVSDTTAAVYILHGLNDWNVKPIQFGGYWQALQRSGINAKMLLHQGAHIYINDTARLDYYDCINLWLSHHLWQRDNKADRILPDVLVQSNCDAAQWYAAKQWPAAKRQRLYRLGAKNILTTGSAAPAAASFTDDVDASGYRRAEDNLREWRDAFVNAAPGKRRDQLAFRTKPFTAPVRVSGTVQAKICAVLDRPTGILSVMLVDYGRKRRLLEDTEVIQKDGIVWGYGQTQDMVDFKREQKPSAYRIITRGHMNVQNLEGACGAVSIEPGRAYTFMLDLHPMDYTLPQGHRLGIIVYGTDMELTPRPYEKTTFTLQLDRCVIHIPLTKP